MDEMNNFSDSITDSEDDYDRQVKRFKGSAAIYRSLIEEESALYGALQDLRNLDLAAHLYNAHCIRRRQYESAKASSLPSWASKKSWRKDVPEKRPGGDGWAPPKVWTAWPMPADEVPRSNEQVGESDGNEAFTFGHGEMSWPSSDLQDVLLGLILRLARENFDLRRTPIEYERHASEESHIVDATQSSTTATPAFNPASPGGSAIPTTDDDEGKATNLLQGNSPSSGLMTSTNSGGATSADDTDFADDSDIETIPDGGLDIKQEDEEKPATHDFPVTSADDEVAAEILQPSIRHILSRLDEILAALHHARNACFAYGSESGSQSEQDDQPSSGTVKVQPPEQPLSPSAAPKKGRGRPKMVVILPVDVERNDISTQGIEIAPNNTGNEIKRGRGRPKKIWPMMDGETEHDRLLRIARLQKAKIPFSGKEPTVPQSRKTEERRSPLPQTVITRRKRLNTRDWSEVVGSATLIGLPPDVVARTAQRCANLFGEGMDFRRLTDTSTAKTAMNDIERYVPSNLFRSTTMGDVMHSESEADMQSCIPLRSESKRQERLCKCSDWRHFAHFSDSLLCPFDDCPRHSQGFNRKDNLRMHLKRAHKLTLEQANKIIMGFKVYNTRTSENEDEWGNESELLDGVHLDGFLQQIPRHPSWRVSSTTKKRMERHPTEISGNAGTSQSESTVNIDQAVGIDREHAAQSEEESGRGEEESKDEDDGYEDSGDERMSVEEETNNESEGEKEGEEGNEDTEAEGPDHEEEHSA